MKCENCVRPDPCGGRVNEDGECGLHRTAEEWKREHADHPESLAAILAEMRDKRIVRLDGADVTRCLLLNLADRIEAAAKRLAIDWAHRIEAAKRETESLRVKMESEKRWACEYFDIARRREDALAHCKQYAQKIERENEEGETRLDAEEIIATIDNEFAGIRPACAPGNAAAPRKFDEAAFDQAVSKPNGWSDVADPVAEIRRMRDGDAPGNAAALREALTAFVDSIQWLCDGDELGIFKKQFAPLLSDALAALAAPARNCDRPECADVESAWATYCAETNRADCREFARWLFAPAEGGAE